MQTSDFRFSVWRLMRMPVSVALLCATFAMHTSAAPEGNAPGAIADEQLYSFIGKDALPAGTIPWQLLRQVKLIDAKQTGAKALAMLPEFSAPVKKLDKSQVKIYGFVLPLSTGQKQKHFLISPLPSHCPFCVNQGPDSMVEVVAKTPLEFSPWEPIVLSGRLELVNDQYLFYRLTNAELVKL